MGDTEVPDIFLTRSPGGNTGCHVLAPTLITATKPLVTVADLLITNASHLAADADQPRRETCHG